MPARDVKVGDQFAYGEQTYIRIVPVFPVDFNVVYTLYREWIYAVNLETGGVVIVDADTDVNNA